LDLYGSIPIIGIAKKLEELFFPGDKIPLHLSKKSESLKLIQQLRDEAHRFAITFHRKLRSKGSLISELDSLKGIGKTSKDKLLMRFRTMSNIKKASVTELAEEIGLARAKKLKEQLK
ncbi:MAG: excinuclease ABC subunit C, partial [Cyclobacteriaceae bacterium]